LYRSIPLRLIQVTCAFRFLRQPSRPKPPMPVVENRLKQCLLLGKADIDWTALYFAGLITGWRNGSLLHHHCHQARNHCRRTFST
jgi:hypothetical protein